jgi:hypothetical protein
MGVGRFVVVSLVVVNWEEGSRFNFRVVESATDLSECHVNLLTDSRVPSRSLSSRLRAL